MAYSRQRYIKWSTPTLKGRNAAVVAGASYDPLIETVS